MTYIYVNKSRLKNHAMTSKNVASQVEKIRGEFHSIGSRLDWDIKGLADIDTTIRKMNQDMELYVKTLTGYSQFFEKAAAEYQHMDSEEKIQTASRSGVKNGVKFGSSMPYLSSFFGSIAIGRSNPIQSFSAGMYSTDSKGKQVFNPHVDAVMSNSVSLLEASAGGVIELGKNKGDAQIAANGRIEVAKASYDIGVKGGIRNSSGAIDPNFHVGVGAQATLVAAKSSVGFKLHGKEIVKATAGVTIGADAHANMDFKNGVFSVDVGAAMGVGTSVMVEVNVKETIQACMAESHSLLMQYLKT